jgi:hypothetical protein
LKIYMGIGFVLEDQLKTSDRFKFVELTETIAQYEHKKHLNGAAAAASFLSNMKHFFTPLYL